MAEEKTAISPLKQFNMVLTNQKTTSFLDDLLKDRKTLFTSNLAAIVAKDKKLQNCEPMSIIMAAVTATSMGLSFDPNLGRAYIIPYGNVATFQVGWKGLRELALKTGYYDAINTRDVREGEIKNEDYLTGRIDFAFVDDRENKKVIGYLAHVSYVGGGSETKYMTVEQITAHAKQYSKSYNGTDSRWKIDFDKMARKTVLKLLLNQSILSESDTQLAKAIKFDQSKVNENFEPEYVDNQPDLSENGQKFSEDMKAKFGAGTQTEIPATEFEEIKK